MFLLFFFAFLGAWQLLVAFYGLNGLSLTGYPDRRCMSLVLGSVLVAASCSWYFSAPGHFASPDVEGVETLIVLIAGLVAATLAQVALASAARVFTGERVSDRVGSETPEDVTVTVGDGDPPVLLLHDYGGSRRDVEGFAARVAASGIPVLPVDLDGHGANPRDIVSMDMRETLDEAARVLSERAGGQQPVAVGVGLGGTLALEMVRRGTAAGAFAIDPPARDDEGFAHVNVLRELGPLYVARSFFRPPARGSEGKRVSMSRVIRSLPPPSALPDGKVRIIGTAAKWLNSPDALAEYARLCGASEPELIDTNHRGLLEKFQLGTDP
jgi:pimeloyl-ACP methyl ester carboxylesterase